MTNAAARSELAALVGDFRAWFEWAELTGLEDWPHERPSEPEPAVASPRPPADVDRRPPTIPAPPPRAPAPRELGTPPPAAPVVAAVLQRARAGGPGPSTDSLELVRADIGLNCRRCALCDTRRRIVPGGGAASAAIMVVGDTPGPHDDETGEAWISDSGPLLTRMLRAIGHERSTVFLTHLVKCRPASGREPTAAEIASCRPFVERQRAAIQPAVVLALGPLAARALSGSDEPLASLRERELFWHDIPLVVSFDPAYLLKAPQMKRLAWDDLRRVRAIASLRR